VSKEKDKKARREKATGGRITTFESGSNTLRCSVDGRIEEAPKSRLRCDGVALYQYLVSTFEVRTWRVWSVHPDLWDLGDENSDPWDPGYSINNFYNMFVTVQNVSHSVSTYDVGTVD
jgi:hypothetical protein